jgi:D-lactate dehydrogenase (cytochrome)
VKLYPQPEAVSAAVCNFSTVHEAVQCVIQTIQMGIPVARVELMDAAAVVAGNRYSKLTLRETPLLLFEFHGSQASVTEQAQVVQELAKECGGMDFEWADRPEDRNRLWTARHNAYFAGLQLRPGCRSSTTDVCVPLSRLAECIGLATQELGKASFPSTIVGHVGDGNFHVLMLLDPESQAEWDESERINNALVMQAIEADGTCTGEHGIGLHKMHFMAHEHGEDALDLMRSLKAAFDPQNILNPGKMIEARA